MWFAVDRHACPAVRDNLDVGSGDVCIALDEVCTKDGCIELGRVDGIFLGFDVDCVFDRIGSYHYAVVCLGVSG